MDNINYLFWLRKNQKNKFGEVKIYCRIFSPTKRVNLSTGESVHPTFWKHELKRVSKDCPRSKIINDHLDRIEYRIRKIIYKLEDENKHICPQTIKDEIEGKTNKDRSLLDVFDFYITQHNSRSTKRTLKNYLYSKQRIETFLLLKKSKTNVYLKEVNLAFITEFENFLCADQGIKPISANKHTQRLKTVMKFATKMGFISSNPLLTHERLKEQKKEIIFLTEDELEKLENKHFKVERLGKIRDLFIFSCYTGLAYQEIKELTSENLIKGIDGKLWLSYTRFKTLNTNGIPINIPLLNKALRIIQHYSIDPDAVINNKLLPVPSNQKFNAYLKEIADLCEINKELTTHVARKTFATTITLANDVPIETVSQALGHSSIKITQQYYAKVVPQKIMRDMNKLELKLSQGKMHDLY